MAKLNLLSPNETERLIEFYMANSESFQFGVLNNGEAAFMLKNEKALSVNKDGSVTWRLREIGVGLHSFLELTTGETKRKTVYLPLCLVNKETRQLLTPLLNSTVKEEDGRLNSRDGEFWILTPLGLGFKVHCKLENLTLQHVMLKFFPSDFALRFETEHCPFCRKKLRKERVK